MFNVKYIGVCNDSCRGQVLSTVASPAMKCSLNVAMVCLAALMRWLWEEIRQMSILLYLMYASIIFCNFESGLVSAGCKGGENVGEGGNHGSVILGGHSVNKDGVEVIDVCNKDVLHGFKGADRERTQEVSVHCACVKIGKGGKTKHVMGRADFFGRLDIVDVAPGLDDGRLNGARGLNALPVAPHVALVGCCGIKQVGVDKMHREDGDGHKFPALVQGLYKCSRRRRAKGLVDVACIFASR